jgi:hypothetical protein
VGGLGTLLKRRNQPAPQAGSTAGPSFDRPDIQPVPTDPTAKRAHEQAIFRRDALKLLKWGLVAAFVYVVVRSASGGTATGSTSTSSSTSALSVSSSPASRVSSAEIVDWNWYADPDFGTDGSVIWTVKVKNNGS